jgi:hypothetical protein
MEKSLLSPGKNKNFILKDMAKNRKKFFEPFFVNIPLTNFL